MALTIGEKIKVVIGRRNMTITQLASEIGLTRQNLTNKLSRDNFSESDVKKIANALNCKYDVIFTMIDTGEKI